MQMKSVDHSACFQTNCWSSVESFALITFMSHTIHRTFTQAATSPSMNTFIEVFQQLTYLCCVLIGKNKQTSHYIIYLSSQTQTTTCSYVTVELVAPLNCMLYIKDQMTPHKKISNCWDLVFIYK